MRDGLWRAVVTVTCLVLAGCIEDSPPEEPTPSRTAPLPPLQTRPSATDGGAVAITEVGFSVIEERDTGSAVVVWAAAFENTSDTDLLAHVEFEPTWRSTDGQTEVFDPNITRQQRAFDVLPGRKAVVGGIASVGFVPDSLDVVVDTNEWYPMRDLAAHGSQVGVEVTDFHIEVEAAARVHVEFTSSYEQGSDDALHLLVVIRDAAGTLIGAIDADVPDLPAPPPGPREQDGRVELSHWPAEADRGTSEVTIVKICCTWAY